MAQRKFSEAVLRIFLQDCQIYKDGLNGPEVLDAMEVLALRNSGLHSDLNKLEILSFGKFILSLESSSNSDSKVVLRCELHSDGAKIEVDLKRNLLVSYFANEKYLIPVKLVFMEKMENSLRPLILHVDKSEPEVAAAAAIKIAKSLDLTINFSSELLKELEKPSLIEETSPLETQLWPYQSYGFSWMYRLWKCSLGGILGDEMGVGKTLQLMALSCHVAKEGRGPVLIVVPSGLLLKWCKDFINHAPAFVSAVHVHLGPNRSKSSQFLNSKRIILTTYNLVVQDYAVLREIDFSAIVCDEAHELKESRTMKSQAIKGLNSQGKYLATGTPIQNNLGDYWTLIDIVEPGLLGSQQDFELFYSNTPTQAASLVEKTKHRILRRTQEQVGIEIPEGTEFYVPLQLSADLDAEYRQLTLDGSNSVGRGALQRKRQFCAHPSSFELSKNPRAGAKSDYLVTELEKIGMLGEKVVIFVADFNEPRDLYRQLINEELPYFWTGTIDGRTPTDLRHHLLEEFSNHQGSAALLINPLVGGQGLDIVAANHVFHMNPAWNPAKTDQATFRVTRPGQTRQTWSHHLYYAFTVEEAIYNLVLDKRELSDAALEVAEAESQKASKSVLDLFEK